LSLLDYDLIKKTNKPIVGSSDIAVLLNAITEKSGLVTYYGPNVLGKFNQTEEIGMPLLLDKIDNAINLFPENKKEKINILRHGKCQGRLVGGSLGTFVLGLSGSEFMPQFDKTVFFFESASLDYFRIRQHLQNLKTTGFAKNIVALIVGATNQIKDDSIIPFEEMLKELFQGEIPIVTTELFGHGFYFNPTFPIGSMVSIDTKNYYFKIEPEQQ
jgi:muramoyltetrapeptide carboxypeptidase